MIKKYPLVFCLSILMLFGCSTIPTSHRIIYDGISTPTSGVSYAPSTLRTPTVRIRERTSTPTLLSEVQITVIPNNVKPTIANTQIQSAKMDFEPFPTTGEDSLILQSCLTEINSFTVASDIAGTLILDHAPLSPFYQNSKPYKLDLDENITEDLNVDLLSYPDNQLISPNQDRYFFLDSGDNESSLKMHIYNSESKELTSSNWDNSWGRNIRWLDNQRLIITPPLNSEFPYGTQIIFDPFTLATQVLEPNYPGGLNIDIFSVSYNQHINRVIYLAGDSYALLDITANKIIWKKGFAIMNLNPFWLLDGKKAVVSLWNYFPPDTIKYSRSNLFLIDANGVETQLTDLGRSFSDISGIYIEQFKLSQDGKYAAFLVSMNGENRKFLGPVLMILNLDSKHIMNTCLVSATKFLSWSPDGKYLALTVPEDVNLFMEMKNKPVDQTGEVIVIDVENLEAWKMEQNAAVIGWLTNPH